MTYKDRITVKEIATFLICLFCSFIFKNVYISEMVLINSFHIKSAQERFKKNVDISFGIYCFTLDNASCLNLY